MTHDLETTVVGVKHGGVLDARLFIPNAAPQARCIEGCARGGSIPRVMHGIRHDRKEKCRLTTRPMAAAIRSATRRWTWPALQGVAKRQRGVAMLEFVVVGPVLTLIGLSILQYAMLFFAKNQINHATFMAARAGSVNNASLDSVRTAYTRALVPMYGGGRNTQELAQALAKASADVATQTRIELLNPTKESFDDWNDPALQQAIGKGRRVIPNRGLAFKDPSEIKPKSGQNITDANLIKLRITHGYLPKVPLVAGIYAEYLKWLDPKTDAFHTQLVQQGRIPVVTHVTLQMQSDAIEPGNPVSLPGKGNNGKPVNPGDPPIVQDPPPDCETAGCSVLERPELPGPDACNLNTNPDACLPPGCEQGMSSCDPGCGVTYCCLR